MRARVVVFLAAFALTGPLLARPACAFVRDVSASGAPLYWPTSCASVTIYLNGFSMLTADEVAKSIAAAAHAWSPAEVTCPAPDAGAAASHPYFEIIPSLSAGGAVPEVAYDGKNSIIFQTTSWPEYFGFIALTTHFSRSDGEILDTDIEINAVPGTSWANLDPSSTATGHDQMPIDLQAAMTHELGHFIGLKHTCFNTAVDSPPVPDDDQGEPIPDCPTGAPWTPGDLPQARSVMWFYVEPGFASISKRVLAPDDVRGICAIYPAAQDPHACTIALPDDGCGCSAGGAQGARGAGIASLAFVLVAACRRRPCVTPDRDRSSDLAPTSRRG
jgi:hypothetical protein